MAGNLRERLQDGPSKRKRLKQNVNVILFGPYAGDCKYILRDVATMLGDKGDIQADICMDIPDSAALNDIAEAEPDDIYNLSASIECINTADYAAFLFLKARQKRFERYGPFRKENIEYYDRPHYVPQDLNASDAIEFKEWVDRGIPNNNRCFVIYEGDVERALGSLVRGLVLEQKIRTKRVEPESRGNAVQKMARAIMGDFEAWLTNNEARFLDGI